MGNCGVINVLNLVGPYCLTFEDGQLIYGEIAPQLLRGNPVTLDFSDVELFASPFFNGSLGMLLKNIDRSKLRSMLTLSSLDRDEIEMVEDVLDNAERYFKDPKFRRASLDLLEKAANE